MSLHVTELSSVAYCQCNSTDDGWMVRIKDLGPDQSVSTFWWDWYMQMLMPATIEGRPRFETKSVILKRFAQKEEEHYDPIMCMNVKDVIETEIGGPERYQKILDEMMNELSGELGLRVEDTDFFL